MSVDVYKRKEWRSAVPTRNANITTHTPFPPFTNNNSNSYSLHSSAFTIPHLNIDNIYFANCSLPLALCLPPQCCHSLVIRLDDRTTTWLLCYEEGEAEERWGWGIVSVKVLGKITPKKKLQKNEMHKKNVINIRLLNYMAYYRG